LNKNNHEWCLQTGFSPLQLQNYFCKEEAKIPLLKAFAPAEAELLTQAARSQSPL